MTVQTSTNVASFNGDGANKVFPVGYKFNSAADLVVTLIDDEAKTTQILMLNSDFTVAGAGDEEGGVVTLVVAPTAVQRLKVTRVVDILQLTDLRNQGKFYAEIHEDVFDLLIMIDQQQQTEIDDANAKSDEAVATANEANAKSDQAVAKAGQNLVDMQAQYDAFEQGAALYVIGDYAAGLVISAYNQIFRKDGEFYRAAASLDLSYTLTGNWATESVNFVSVGDNVLRQDLANATDPAKGVAIVGRGVVAVDSIVGLLALPAESRRTDLHYQVASYHSGWAAALALPIGGGVFYWEPNRPKSEHNGGDIISNTVPWTGALATLPDFLNGVGETLSAGTGCYVRSGGSELHVASFGAVDRLTGDSTVAAQKALSVASVRAESATSGQSVTLGDLSIKVSGTLDVDPGVHFSGNGIRSVIELDNTVDIDVVTMTGGGPPSSVRNLFIRRPSGNGVGTKSGLMIGPGDGKFVHQVWASGHLNGFHAKEVGDVIISECLAELNNYNFRLENPARVKMVDCVSFLPSVLGCYAFKDNNTWANRRLEIKNFSSVGNGGASRGIRIERVGTFTDEFDDCEVEIFAIDHATGVESVGMKSVKIKANTTSCTTGISLSSSINMKIQHISVDDGTGLTQSSNSTYLNILPGSEYKNPTTRAMTLTSTVKCAETVFEGAESYPSINSSSIGHIFEFGQCTLKSPTFTAVLDGSNYTVKFNECLQAGTAHSISSTATATRLVLRNNNGDTDARTISFNNEVLSGTVSPTSNVTPSYVGQHYRDTVALTTWVSVGLTNTSWVQIQ